MPDRQVCKRTPPNPARATEEIASLAWRVSDPVLAVAGILSQACGIFFCCRYESSFLEAEEEDNSAGGTSNSVYWHGRRGNLLEVREEVLVDREGHRKGGGKEDAELNSSSRKPTAGPQGSVGTKMGATGGTAALPKTSELVRSKDSDFKSQPGRGYGPMAAMLMFSACAEWTGAHCCGQVGGAVPLTLALGTRHHAPRG